MSETVLYEQYGRVAVVTMNRPEVLNAFNRQLAHDLRDAMTRAAGEREVRAVVLRGAGGKFSAGADLKQGFPRDRRIEDLINTDFRPTLDMIAGMEKPVIAAVAGPAAGIGLSFALVCDLVMMADDAYLLSPFATIGLIPDGGATWLLARQLGYHRAYQLCVESERVPAARCVELGLANRVVPAARLDEESLDWARSLAERAPLALARTKLAMRAAMNLSLSEAIAREAHLQTACLESDDAREGIAAFVGKRKPEYKGR
ncbi:MAG TPA: enoyl-CoA hydratase-related protein [Gammaproteobacteria bacterium]|nr:enoyl-CoA hydratase-related protein [Gammaproteobacteria bacterium]